MTRLVKAGLVADDWDDRRRTKGLVSTSVVSFIVRKGNPKNIQTWDDLLKPGVKVLTPNPFTSGAAKWNLLAAYGAKSGGGENPQAGLAYLRELITKHVKVQDKSGREALQNFTSGNGDVLLSYENEAITAQKKGEEVDYVIPDQTIMIENPIAVVRRPSTPEQAKAFLDYVLSRAGPAEVRRLGLPPGRRGGPRRRTRTKFPDAAAACSRSTTSAAGRKVNDELFDPDKGSVAEDRGGRGGLHCQVRHSPRVPPAAAPRAAARRRGRARARRRDAVAERHRPAPAGGRRRPLDRRRPRRVLGRRSPSRQAVAALTLHAVVVAGRRGDQRGRRHARSRGCSCATTSAASASSTRSSTCRSRCRRSSPGITLLALYGPDAARSASTSSPRTWAILHGAAVRDAAVRRALGAAGAASSSTARWRRRRRRSAPAPATIFRRDRPAEPRAGDPVGRGAGVRPRGRRVRLGRADLGQHPVRHAGRVGLHLQADRERRPDRRGGGVRRAAGDLARRPARRSRVLGRWGARHER